MQSSIFSTKFSRNILYNVSVNVAILSLAQLFDQRLYCIVMGGKHFVWSAKKQFFCEIKTDSLNIYSIYINIYTPK